jgi:4-aminobutyrate aminotransferase/(S)-3-amino-2-methylpropionate transaminase
VPTTVAAVVIEPIQGEGGFIVPAPGFLRALQNWCRQRRGVRRRRGADRIRPHRRDVRLRARRDVVPDLIVTAKGIAGGLPLSAVTGRAEIMDAPHAGGLGGTYGGNPVACAAALAVVDTIEREQLVARAAAMGETMISRLHRDGRRRSADRRRAWARCHDRRRAGQARHHRARRRSDQGASRPPRIPRAWSF